MYLFIFKRCNKIEVWLHINNIQPGYDCIAVFFGYTLPLSLFASRSFGYCYLISRFPSFFIYLCAASCGIFINLSSHFAKLNSISIYSEEPWCYFILISQAMRFYFGVVFLKEFRFESCINHNIKNKFPG